MTFSEPGSEYVSVVSAQTDNPSLDRAQGRQWLGYLAELPEEMTDTYLHPSHGADLVSSPQFTVKSQDAPAGDGLRSLKIPASLRRFYNEQSH